MPDIPFTVFSCIGFLLCIPPAYFNWKIPSRPWATLILIGWIFLLNLLYFFDSIIWSDPNPANWWDGKVYCDINARLKDIFAIGVPGAAIGICRFLADATNPDPRQKDLRHGRFKRNMIDLFLGIILPILISALKFIAEPSRYHIAGVDGCTGHIVHAWPALLCYILWTPILCVIAAGYACRFLYHWWIRRRRLNQMWATGLRNGISQSEFRRLHITVLSVLFIYLPLSLIGLANFVEVPLSPFNWQLTHGPLWWIIVFEARPKAIWSSWIGIALAITSFALIGFTRNAKRFYEHCIERFYDACPATVQARLGWMKKISEGCKERRAAQSITNGDARNNISMIEGTRSRKPTAKNWFDSEEDLDDAKSLHSDESMFTGKDEEEGNQRGSRHELDRPFAPGQGTRTEVTGGNGVTPGWAHGVKVTRQVIVETSSR